MANKMGKCKRASQSQTLSGETPLKPASFPHEIHRSSVKKAAATKLRKQFAASRTPRHGSHRLYAATRTGDPHGAVQSFPTTLAGCRLPSEFMATVQSESDLSSNSSPFGIRRKPLATITAGGSAESTFMVTRFVP